MMESPALLITSVITGKTPLKDYLSGDMKVTDQCGKKTVVLCNTSDMISPICVCVYAHCACVCVCVCWEVQMAAEAVKKLSAFSSTFM